MLFADLGQLGLKPVASRRIRVALPLQLVALAGEPLQALGGRPGFRLGLRQRALQLCQPGDSHQVGLAGRSQRALELGRALLALFEGRLELRAPGHRIEQLLLVGVPRRVHLVDSLDQVEAVPVRRGQLLLELGKTLLEGRLRPATLLPGSAQLCLQGIDLALEGGARGGGLGQLLLQPGEAIGERPLDAEPFLAGAPQLLFEGADPLLEGAARGRRRGALFDQGVAASFHLVEPLRDLGQRRLGRRPRRLELLDPPLLPVLTRGALRQGLLQASALGACRLQVGVQPLAPRRQLGDLPLGLGVRRDARLEPEAGLCSRRLGAGEAGLEDLEAGAQVRLGLAGGLLLASSLRAAGLELLLELSALRLEAGALALQGVALFGQPLQTLGG